MVNFLWPKPFTFLNFINTYGHCTVDTLLIIGYCDYDGTRGKTQRGSSPQSQGFVYVLEGLHYDLSMAYDQWFKIRPRTWTVKPNM